MVLVATVVVVAGAWTLPASAQIITTTTTTTQAEPSTTTDLTVLPTTTTLDVTPTTEEETTTTVRRTTTVPTGPAITIPASTTTSELREPAGPVEMPTTTSTAPPKDVDEGLSAGTIVSLIIGVLLLVAAVLGVFTWRFWQATRPTGPTVPWHG